MRKFDKVLNEELETSSTGYFSTATDILRQLDDLQKSLQDMEMRVRHLVEQISASLGAEVRKKQPGLDVNLNNGRCRIGYRSRHLNCQPDFKAGVWNISGSPPFANKFTRTYGHLMNLSDDVTPLAHAMADFFGKRYKSLSEANMGRPIENRRDISKTGAGHYA